MGKKMSLIERLKQIPDPRSRRRREYPLYALLAVLILAAALALLERVDLEGKGVSADTGLLHATLAQKVVAKKGAILG